MGSESQSTIKLLLLVILVAVIAVIIVTVVQFLILGKSNAAITGGAVGAVTAGLTVSIWKKKPATK